jgi:hypothetical protein
MTGFPAWKETWLKKVMAQPDLPAMAFKVAFALSTFLNQRSRCCFPSRETLARETGITARGVQENLTALRRAGLLDIKRRGPHSSIYKPIIDSKDGNSGAHHVEHKDGKHRSHLVEHDATKMGTFPSKDRNGSVKKMGTAVPTEPEENPVENLSTNDTVSLSLAGGTKDFSENEKKRPLKNGSTIQDSRLPIVEFAPDEAAQAEAIKFWDGIGRRDLGARIGAVAADFADYLAQHPDRCGVSPAAAWRRWFRRTPDVLPAANGPGGGIADVAFEQTNIDGWVMRLEMFYGLMEDVAKGTWSPKWGPRPDSPLNRVPAEVVRAFAARRTG